MKFVKNRLGWVVWGLALVPLLGTPASATEKLHRFKFLQIRMGIPVRLTFYAPDQATANQASDAAYDRLRQLDRMMSDFDPDSELMRLCTESTVGEPVGVSGELMHVLSAAEDLSKETSGAFDVTVGPVVNLWRVARRRKQFPDPDRLAAARARVGYRNLLIDREGSRVTLLKRGMQIDLGAIAKGYAADEALRTLRSHGVPRALVDAGGDVVAGDPPPGRKGWIIELEPLRPDAETGSLPPRIHLENAAVATSGDTWQYAEFDGIRYSHIVDPQTGLGLTTPRSVTVIAPSGMQADSLASAVSLLGPERGLELIARTPSVEVHLEELTESEEIRRLRSEGFAAFLVAD